MGLSSQGIGLRPWMPWAEVSRPVGPVLLGPSFLDPSLGRGREMCQTFRWADQVAALQGQSRVVFGIEEGGRDRPPGGGGFRFLAGAIPRDAAGARALFRPVGDRVGSGLGAGATDLGEARGRQVPQGFLRQVQLLQRLLHDASPVTPGKRPGISG